MSSELESESDQEEEVVKLKPNPNLIEVKEEDPNILCMFCRSSKINEVEWGMMYKLNKITVHYFCMLFSSGLKQNGKDNEGIWGFLGRDIEKELRRGEKLKCKYCKKANATVGCIVKSCKTSFHFTCGLSKGTLNEYLGNYPSYCPTHKPTVQIPIPQEEWQCEICYCEVTEDENPLWPPCCKRRVFHRFCIQQSALAAGSHFFKCPACKDSKLFPNAMKQAGVYVPDRDASWESEPNAFADHTQLYSFCDAEECHCPQGRNYSCQDNAQWKVIRCGACGSQGIHMVCGQLELQRWKCPGCLEVLRQGRTRINTGDGNAEMDSESETDETDSGDDVGSSECFSEARYNIARKSHLVGVERELEQLPCPSEYVETAKTRPIGPHCIFNPRLKKTFRVEPPPARRDGDDSDSDTEICVERIAAITTEEETGAVSSFFREFVKSNTVVNSNGIREFRADTSNFRQRIAELKISCTLQAEPSAPNTILDSDKSIPQTRNPTVALPDICDSALETSCKVKNLDLSGNEGRASLSYVSAPEHDDDIEVTAVINTSPDNRRNGSDCENVNPRDQNRLPEKYKQATARSKEILSRATQSMSNSKTKSRFRRTEASSPNPDLADGSDNLPCTSKQAASRRAVMDQISRCERCSSPEIEIVSEMVNPRNRNGPVKKGIVTFMEYDTGVIPTSEGSTFKLSSSSINNRGNLTTNNGTAIMQPGNRSVQVDVITLSDSENDSGNGSSGNNLTPSTSRNVGNTVSGLSESDDDIMIIEGVDANKGASSNRAPDAGDKKRHSLKSHSSRRKRLKNFPKKKTKKGETPLSKRSQSSPESRATGQKRHKRS